MDLLRFSSRKWALLASIFLLLARTSSLRAATDEPPTLGFEAPESFPLDAFVSQLHAADLDGDGLTDMVVVNNSKARITLLLNRTGKPIPADEARTRKDRDVNELPPDARFKIDSLTSEKRIAALVVADLNGDGRPDIAYFGEPKPLELVIHYNQGNLSWSPPKRWQIDDGQMTAGALAVGDLNGDGRPDIVVLAENHIAFLAQNADHTLADPEKIPFTGTAKGVEILDVNGDGRDDLALVTWDSPNPIRFRLQNSAGQLGPEIHFAMSPIRSVLAEDLNGDHKAEVVTISQSSGRAQISSLAQKAAPTLSGAFAAGQFQVLPLTKTSKPKRGILWGDVDGNGLADLLIALPETGQVMLYLQQPDGTLGAGKTFPSFAGITDIALSPANSGTPATIYLLSSDERQVGKTSLNAQGRIPFPATLPLDGKPLALAVGSLTPGGSPVFAAIVEQNDRRHFVIETPSGALKSQALATSFKSNPTSLVFHDINQDGLLDLVVMIPYEKLKILLQTQDQTFQEIDLATPGGSSEQPWSSAADVDGDGTPELLLAQKNFLRAVVLKKGPPISKGGEGPWTLEVKDQLNGVAANSRIIGATPLRNGTNTIDSVFLLDGERKVLSLSERDRSGVWQSTRTVALPYTEFTELRSVGIGQAKANSVAFLGSSGIGWLALSGDVWELTERDGYETPIKEGRLTDVIAGDLTGDGRKDLVFLETSKNHLDLVTLSKDGKLIPGNRWQVFEERTFRNRRGEGTEPREACVGDFNGDKKMDLAIIVHDRVLVYLRQ